MPDQWEDTRGMESSDGESDRKDIVSGSPFLFYWVNGQIQIIKHRDDKIPCAGSNEDWLMGFGRGLCIKADQKKESFAYADNDYWVHP